MIAPTYTLRLARPLLASLASMLFAFAVVACGSASKVAHPSSSISHEAESTAGALPTTATAPEHPARSGSYLKVDGDKDNDDEPNPVASENDDQNLYRLYGEGASRADARTVRKLVRRYYAAAVAGDGEKACSLLYAGVAREVAASQGLSGQGGARNDCAKSMSSLLVQQHQRLLADDLATMLVTSVHVKGDIGLAVLGFRAMPEGEIAIEREGRVWKIDALFDSEMT